MSMVLEAPAVCYCAPTALPGTARSLRSSYNRRDPWKSVNNPLAGPSGAQQAADLLGFAQYRTGDRGRLLGAAAQARIDITGIGQEAAHLAADPPQHCNRNLG